MSDPEAENAPDPPTPAAPVEAQVVDLGALAFVIGLLVLAVALIQLTAHT